MNECSDIYELDLGSEPFDKPVYVQLPLPKWYTDLINSSKDPPEPVLPADLDLPDRAENEDDKSPVDKNSNNIIPLDKRPKNLTLLYQTPGTKRQIVWRVATGDANSDNMTNRRKVQKNGPFRDIVSTKLMHVENMRAKNGWMNLMLGVKGGSWQPLQITGPFTPRTISITTYQLGRFALLYANDPERTAPSKIAHLMSRMESLCVAPPGVLLVCLQVTALKWTLWMNMVPSSKLIGVLEERLQSGFIPLVQTNASPLRRTSALANCAMASLSALQPPDPENTSPTTVPTFGTTKYRLGGPDFLHVLLYNGICVKLVIKGKIQIRTSGMFDPFTNVLDARRKEGKSNKNVAVASRQACDDEDLEIFAVSPKKQPEEVPVSKASLVKQPEEYVTKQETRLSYYDLLPDTATVIELAPTNEGLPGANGIRTGRDKLIKFLMQRRLELFNREPDTTTNQNLEKKGESNEVHDTQNNYFDFAVNNSTLDLNSETDDEQSAIPEMVQGFDGDENVEEQHFDDLKEAFRQKNSPNLGYEISKDIARRMCKIFDKAKAEEASDIVKRLYDAYLVGRVEVYLVQPTDLLQVQENEPSQEPDGDNENNNGEASEQKGSKESHNAVKFSDAPVEKEEEEDDADKPLVSFDILIDPGLYARKFKKKVVEEK